MLLGIPDFGILSAYLLSVLSAILCLIYGLYNWNKGSEEENRQIMEEAQWEKGQQNIDANM
ncbi:MAG: hypothetical protein K0R50_2654 [Eubacterium sp.]|nr:hypothetical protein [Eubacterium sp.]